MQLKLQLFIILMHILHLIKQQINLKKLEKKRRKRKTKMKIQFTHLKVKKKQEDIDIGNDKNNDDDNNSQDDPEDDAQTKEDNEGNEENDKKKGKKGKKKKDKKKKKKKKGKIKIEDVNEKDEISSKISQIFELNDNEKNELDYEKALKIDNRNFYQYYCFMLQLNNILINTFFRGKDYNLFSVKFSLLLMAFPINLTFNAFFFTNKQIQYIYINKNNNISID